MLWSETRIYGIFTSLENAAIWCATVIELEVTFLQPAYRLSLSVPHHYAHNNQVAAHVQVELGLVSIRSGGFVVLPALCSKRTRKEGEDKQEASCNHGTTPESEARHRIVPPTFSLHAL
jgi:hypothetical protein